MPRHIRSVLFAFAIGAVLVVGLNSCSTQAPAKKITQNPPKKAAHSPKSEPLKAAGPGEEATMPAAVPVEAPPKAQEPPAASQEPPAKEPANDSVRVAAAPPADRNKVSKPKRYAGYPTEIAYVKDTDKIALTFDAGASAAPTPAILAALKEADLQVTFFLTGKWCEKNPELVKRIINEGHEIGNHSYSHPDFRKINDSAIIEQLKKVEDIVVNLTGQSTKPLFRPPYGGRDKRVLSVVGEQGYTSIYWSLDSLDAFKKGITSTEIQQRILKRIQGGDIVLMHCGSEPTAKQLPELIDKLKERGFTMVKVSELVAKE